jgi:hypothetical protein
VAETLRINNPQNPDPTEVVAELKKQGIASLDDLVKKAIELHKQASPVVFDVYWGHKYVFWI